MSQWDGLPENPPPLSMLGKQGQKAQAKVTAAVVDAQKPPTQDQARRIIDARQALVGEILNDAEFDPDTRVAELEGKLLEHIETIDGLFADLAAWRGAARWRNNVTLPYRPVPATSTGRVVQKLRLAPVADAAALISALHEVLGVAPRDDGLQRVPEFSQNEFKRPERMVA